MASNTDQQPSEDQQQQRSGAADEKNDKLHQSKKNVKFVRILTVLGYVFCVSSAAIMLSLYYIFLWDPYSGMATAQAFSASPSDLNNGSSMSKKCAALIQEARQATGALPQVQALRQPSFGPPAPDVSTNIGGATAAAPSFASSR